MSEDVAEYRPPTPLVVWLLTGAIALTYVAYVLTPFAERQAIEYAFALIPERFHTDSPYRFVQWYEALGPIFGHAFLHVAWWHAGLNAFFFMRWGATRRCGSDFGGFWRCFSSALQAARSRSS